MAPARCERRGHGPTGRWFLNGHSEAYSEVGVTIVSRRGGFEVSVYDPVIKRKRYVGRRATQVEAQELESTYKAAFSGKGPDVRRCPGCRKPFIPEDEWQKRCSPRCESMIKRRERRAEERRTDDHWTYTALNAEMEVIYVGVTSTGLRRHRAHGRYAAWWPEVAFMRIEHHATREEALKAEAEGIARHQPRHNTFLKGDGEKAAAAA